MLTTTQSGLRESVDSASNYSIKKESDGGSTKELSYPPKLVKRSNTEKGPGMLFANNMRFASSNNGSKQSANIKT